MSLQQEINRKVSAYRKIQRLMALNEFSTLSANDNSYVEYIINVDADGLAKWIKQHLYRDLGEKSTRQLRTIASKLGIPRYTLLTKAELLSEIVNHDNRRFDLCGNGIPHSQNEKYSTEKV
jgi:hypothetical protein